MFLCVSGQGNIMATGKTRNVTWKEDEDLKNALKLYVRQSLQRHEILSFMERDFPMYSWSLSSLDRRLKFLNIKRFDYDITIEELKKVTRKEINGPGKLLGYRALHLKIRQAYGLHVTRDIVYAAMTDICPAQLEMRRPNKKTKRVKGNFVSNGPDWVLALDGHDKLMGYQNSTFPIAIYGCIDTASRKILWLRAWNSNSRPELPGRWYFDYLYRSKCLPNYLRMDRGSETGIVATMHAFLRWQQNDLAEEDASNTVIYGPSTSNQIERWWRELHERLEKYYKNDLRRLLERNQYNPESRNDRNMLSFLKVPIVQREIDLFKDYVWNSHRIRGQKDTVLPSGVPNHVYDFPEEYGLTKCGFDISEDTLKDVAELSGVLEGIDDFLDGVTRERFKAILPYPNLVKNEDWVDTFLYLKNQSFSNLI